MRRADRLFDIIQALRGRSKPLTAAALAERLEVTTRTIYRDIAVLQARRIPIEGEAGVGYVLRKGFDLPPLMFTLEEIESIALGAQLVRRLRDPKLQQAAEGVLSKVSIALPAALRDVLTSPRFRVSACGVPRPTAVNLAEIRAAIHDCRKVRISYIDEKGRRSQRTVRPVAMVYYSDVTLVAGWCEHREDYRHFRLDRIEKFVLLEENFASDGGRLLAEWSGRHFHA
jgi:predicted DNA-binding transcriptional regulator YafY